MSPEVAAEAAHRDRDLRRLLASWQRIAARYIHACGHPGLDDEIVLSDALAGIEAALRERHPREWVRLEGPLQQLMLELDHADPATPATACIICRRLAGGLPISVAQLVEEARR
ncbi:MAG: hypothetical protein JWO98_1704 [Frankiales bacterium]|nr:hypothetical protein [Frankiales bacterium]